MGEKFLTDGRSPCLPESGSLRYAAKGVLFIFQNDIFEAERKRRSDKAHGKGRVGWGDRRVPVGDKRNLPGTRWRWTALSWTREEGVA